MARHDPSAGSPFEPVRRRLEGPDATAPDPDAVPTGFPTLDRALAGGLRRGDLVVLAGDVASGKSALGLGIALRAAAAGHPAAFLTGEMPPERVLERALAMEGRVALEDLRQGRLDEPTRLGLTSVTDRLKATPLAVRPLAGASFEEVEEAARADPAPRLLVVDALQLVATDLAATRLEERVALAARALKGLALRARVAVLALAGTPGLDRARPDKRPTLDDLGGVGAVKQVADVVLGLYREEMYHADQGIEGATELLVAKNRHGPTTMVDLFFYRRWLRFEDMEDPER